VQGIASLRSPSGNEKEKAKQQKDSHIPEQLF
jgi:hypothetical protein